LLEFAGLPVAIPYEVHKLGLKQFCEEAVWQIVGI
jgi:hypothetical protein